MGTPGTGLTIACHHGRSCAMPGWGASCGVIGNLTLLQLLVVFAAGGLGATLRVLLIVAVDLVWGAQLPAAGMLAVNSLGCLMAGLVVGGASEASALVRLALGGGFLGGFTTYGAFSVFLIQHGRARGILAAGGQATLHLGLGLACAAAGIWLATQLRAGSVH